MAKSKEQSFEFMSVRLESFGLDEFLDEQKEKQKKANDDFGPPGAEPAVKSDGRLDNAENQNANQGARDVSHAAGEKGSADDDGGDGVEFEACSGIWITGEGVEAIHNTG